VQVDGFEARALLDPWCAAELVLSNSFATQCGMHSQVDEETLIEFADGTRVPSTSIENVSLSVAGVSHPVCAVVVELAAYEVILGKPWFTRHNPIVDWRRHELRLVIDCRTVIMDTSASPQRESSKDIIRFSAKQLKKVVRRKDPVYLVHLCQIGVDADPAKGSPLPDAWECMLDEFSDVFPVDQPGLPPERSVAMEIERWRKEQNLWRNPR
jgi:hypothetical protein